MYGLGVPGLGISNVGGLGRSPPNQRTVPHVCHTYMWMDGFRV